MEVTMGEATGDPIPNLEPQEVFAVGQAEGRGEAAGSGAKIAEAKGNAVGFGTAVAWTRQAVGVAYDWLAYWFLVAAASVVAGIKKPGTRGPEPGTIDRYGEGRRALFPEIATLMKDERLSVEQAALRLGNRIPGAGTRESRAHSLAKMFRDASKTNSY
jgi:hypothetical protein